LVKSNDGKVRFERGDNMGTIRQSFVMTAGNTKKMNVTITNAVGQAIDLTGVSLTWVLKRMVTSPITLEKTNASGITITDPKKGKCTIVLQPADTKNLSGNMYHELQLIDGLGDVSTPFVGNIYFEKSGI
jgi:hypothetical protein